MPALPSRLLHEVYWSFAEPVPSSPAQLVEALREYAVEVETPDPSMQVRQPLPFSDVVLRYTTGYRKESGDWQDELNELRVVAPTSTRLTGVALLWELHVACQVMVGEDDRHFFEGLELVAEAEASRPPVYEVLLGS